VPKRREGHRPKNQERTRPRKRPPQTSEERKEKRKGGRPTFKKRLRPTSKLQRPQKTSEILKSGNSCPQFSTTAKKKRGAPGYSSEFGRNPAPQKARPTWGVRTNPKRKPFQKNRRKHGIKRGGGEGRGGGPSRKKGPKNGQEQTKKKSGFENFWPKGR